eukprot:7043892-Prorocentrum_lima.AAC.1
MGPSVLVCAALGVICVRECVSSFAALGRRTGGRDRQARPSTRVRPEMVRGRGVQLRQTQRLH